jgi:hypothetical protein
MDPVRVRQLAETIRSDPDEKRRKAAITDLLDADPRAFPEVIPALISALQKDTPTVRVAAAEAIGQFNVVFPLAGVALEYAAEQDPSQAVRRAAQQALWEYHLNGYRSTKGVDGFTVQTAEPPIAKPGKPRPKLSNEPPLAPVVSVSASTPPSLSPATLSPVVTSPVVTPTLNRPPGPRKDFIPRVLDIRAALYGPAYLNRSVEPPIAKPSTTRTFPATLSMEPPIQPLWPDPVVLGKPPPIVLDLPPVVSPPDTE